MLVPRGGDQLLLHGAVADIEGDRAAVSIVGADLSQLVGQDGEVLEALQELTRLAVYRETGERSRLMLDVSGHRAERRSALEEQALALAKSRGSEAIGPTVARINGERQAPAIVDGTFEALDLRRAMGGFATGVTVVTSRSPSGQAAGVTVNSFCSVSLDPPLVLWCLARRAPSLPVFARASHFAIHVLSSDQAALSRRFSRPAEDKFAGLMTADGLGGVPLLDGAAVRFECRREHDYESGDHLILIGRIERYCYCDRAPLLFHVGRMHGE